MANKYLDLVGLQRLVNKIKDLIPSKVGELENDKGFITLEEVPSYDPSAVKRFQEKFIVANSSVFNFTKGQYTLGGNFVNWYLDGIKQSNDTLIEINETTVEVVGGLPQGSTVVFDYVEHSHTIAGVKGDKGDKGDTGEQGIQGIQGDPGIVDYTGLATESYVDDALEYKIRFYDEGDEIPTLPADTIAFIREV